MYTLTCISQVAEFLTGQFYEPNYSIRQRLDIVEVLSLQTSLLIDFRKALVAIKREITVTKRI